VIGFLRCIGLLNAAAWFGAGVFITLGVGSAMSDSEMHKLLQAYYEPYSEIISQIIRARFYRLGIVCGIVAIVHLLAEQFYFGRAPQKRWLSLLVVLLALSLLGGCWLPPKLYDWHKLRSDAKTPPQTREAASRSFQLWHGISQAANIVMLTGLGFYLVRVGSSGESTRFIGSGKFRS
jgi:uncharacterized membrane protein